MLTIKAGYNTLATYNYAAKNGKLTSLIYGNDDSETYTYDHLDRLVKVVYNEVANSGYELFYNANGRLFQTIDHEAGITHTYEYDSSGQIFGFTYYLNSGSPSQYFYGKNAQGDVICIYNASGTTVARYNYDAWGACTIEYDNTSIGIANINPIRYRSYYYDAETSLYYLQSRYYDPAVGRFISPDDPALLGANGDLLSYNLYAYCSNNPVNYSDPSGHSFLLTILVGSLIGFTISATSSIIGQYMAKQDWTQINFWEVLYDGAWGALYGALACTNISTLGSVLVGMGGGFISSIGHDYLFLGAEFELSEAILNAVINGVIGGVGGLIGGPGSRASIEKYIHTRTVLRSTLGKHGQTVLFRQTRSVFKHAKDLLISGVRYFVGNFSAGTISKQEVYTI